VSRRAGLAVALALFLGAATLAAPGGGLGGAGQPGTPPPISVDVAPCAGIASLSDPRWANVNQWNAQILAAQQQVQAELGVLVPANVVKAVMMIETGGIMPDSANYAGAAGLMQVVPTMLGAAHYDFQRNATDPGYSIYAGTYELALRYLDSGRLPWRNVVVGYFAGHYYPDGSSDAYNSDHNYQRMFDTYMAELEAAAAECAPAPGGTPGPGGTPAAVGGDWLAAVGTGIDGLAAIWGNVPAVLAQEFGPTDFSMYVHPEWYAYSLAFGFPAPGHTGLDVAIPANTPLYAPAEAVVVCAGTDNGTGEVDCAAFDSATGGPTSGRLQLRLANGDMLILGAVNRTEVPPGATVRAGQRIGLSGGYNGDHVHVEYRVKDLTTSSGWRIIDPRLTPLNGIQLRIDPNQPTPTPGPTAAPPTPAPTAVGAAGGQGAAAAG
jgi:murein DD-endopeptidase MepM/ murein hydrolase activator NlpD